MHFWLLSAFLLLVFLTGGSSRLDVQSLAILRPAAVLLCAFSILSLRIEHIKDNRIVFCGVAALFAVTMLYIIPLPSAVGSFPGKHANPMLEKLTGLNGAWHPLSASPNTTMNSLFALFVPLAVLLLGVQLNREQRFLLLPVLLFLGLLTVFFGFLQAVSGYDSSFHFYRVTNEGTAVGLFANRNHQALMLAILFPMLMAFALSKSSGPNPERWRSNLAIATGAVVIPLLLITGSRTGLVLGAIGLSCFPLFYGVKNLRSFFDRSGQHSNLFLFLAGGAVALLVTITVLAARAEAVKRMFMGANTEDLRWTVWDTAFQIGKDNFPIGSGMGTFPRIYQSYERDLDLTFKYVNQAHNDWLDIFLTLGVAGVALLAFAIIIIARLSFAALRSWPRASRDVTFARLGLIILLFTAVASVVDYPLRTPIISSICIIAYLWLDGIRNAPIRS